MDLEKKLTSLIDERNNSNKQFMELIEQSNRQCDNFTKVVSDNLKNVKNSLAQTQNLITKFLTSNESHSTTYVEANKKLIESMNSLLIEKTDFQEVPSTTKDVQNDNDKLINTSNDNGKQFFTFRINHSLQYFNYQIIQQKLHQKKLAIPFRNYFRLLKKKKTSSFVRNEKTSKRLLAVAR